MQFFWSIVIALFLVHAAQAQTLTVGNVKVYVKADSAATARENAIDHAHQLAFKKLLNENYPDHPAPLPSTEALREMVKDFSIEREKTTPTSYAASLAFQFDEPMVLNWLQRDQQNPSSSPFSGQTSAKKESLKVMASYKTHAEWQHIRKTLENFPSIQSLSVFTLSPKNASIMITYRGSIDRLTQDLAEKNIQLIQQEGEWVVSSIGEVVK